MATVQARRVELPWGRATIEQEIAIMGSASGDERQVELGIAWLRGVGDDGGDMLRFFYRVNGRVMRGPLTLREDELTRLAAALAAAPELRALVRRLGR
jgi:hypothetical protein